MRAELARQIGQQLGEEDGVLVFDPSSFPKSGRESVGVDRQWSGRLGKVDNCQVAVYLGYVSRKEHALVDTRLYLPEEWAKDAERRTAVGVPQDIVFLEKWRIALEEIDALLAEELPPAPVVADAGYGDTTGFRDGLTERGFSYVVGIKGTTTVWAPGKQPLPPRSSGRGRPPTRLRRDAQHQHAARRLQPEFAGLF